MPKEAQMTVIKPGCCGHIGCQGKKDNPCGYVLVAMISDSPRCGCTGTPKEYRIPFDPSCTVWTSFGELQLGDQVDYWGAACPVVELDTFEGDPVRVRIEVQQEHGRQLALAPAYEGTWRAPREGEAVEVAELFPEERFDADPDAEYGLPVAADSEGWDPDDPYGDVAEYERKAGE